MSAARPPEGAPVSQALLSVEGLDVRYGAIQAVRGVSFEVREGATVALIGANGAGKSSIMRCLSGLVPSAAGRLLFEGRRLPGRPSAVVRSGIVQVPEGRQVFPSLSVEENLRLGGFRLDKSHYDASRQRMFERFPRLAERRHQLAGLLSGGEQQMLAMARALMAGPRLLILDEPSMGLAPNLVAEVFEVIAELKAAGTTILLVEQNARRALAAADYAYVLEVGRVVAHGTPAQLAQGADLASAYLGGH